MPKLRGRVEFHEPKKGPGGKDVSAHFRVYPEAEYVDTRVKDIMDIVNGDSEKKAWVEIR